MTKEDQFEDFWRSYPRRVAKGAARKAFDKAIRKATLEEMKAAILDYIAKKPERIDFKHPATWLNSECWSDEWPEERQINTGRRTVADVAREFIERSGSNNGAPFGVPFIGHH